MLILRLSFITVKMWIQNSFYIRAIRDYCSLNTFEFNFCIRQLCELLLQFHGFSTDVFHDRKLDIRSVACSRKDWNPAQRVETARSGLNCLSSLVLLCNTSGHLVVESDKSLDPGIKKYLDGDLDRIQAVLKKRMLFQLRKICEESVPSTQMGWVSESFPPKELLFLQKQGTKLLKLVSHKGYKTHITLK